MRTIIKAGCILGLLVVVTPLAAPKAAPEAEPGSIVIVFKDGHQQNYRLADIARIEFTPPAQRVSERVPSSSARFLGQWKVGDGVGGTFIITLKPDGVARKTLGSEGGMWTAVNGEAHIAWDDGWHDYLRKVDGKYQKAAFRPGADLTGSPDHVAEASYIEAH